MKKVAITTLGCKVNQFESASFASSFAQAGCELVPFAGKADVYVINTCAVTGRAAQQSRQLIRRALKANPAARLVVTGCFAQMAPSEIVDLADSPLCIVGNGNKHLVVEAALTERTCDLSVLMGNIRLKREITPLPVRRFSGRTRAFLRIQDGCDNFCSYCIVPYTRGRSRSLPMEQVLEQTAVFAGEGYREIVITGINVGKYGLDLVGGISLTTLIARLCRDFPTMRFRLSSVELTEVDDRLLALMNNEPNFMPHLHIPLQSGDNDILARMNRRYTAEEFSRTVTRIAGAVPPAAIGCDILCGFPGESEAAHDNTFRLLADLPVTYLHVFPYSRRPGTLAASMNRQLPKKIKDQRVRRLRELDRTLRSRFHELHFGTVRQVLVERVHRTSGLLQGFSDNYIPVRFEGDSRLKGTIVPVRLDRFLADGGIFGTAVQTQLEIISRNR
ncbi:MAG: tRNA (N(6)-L-threonylcarbamoyladenosine(37)-C(2))-methylthiotransferase MtaB [Desulfobulbaceae bacterium]|nr:tRNA (N(6)-L-threonylcarbamoyladenosine(37)-C(2))-methylthiotransferase MtaB [Desulfobulbaceae bacterium]